MCIVAVLLLLGVTGEAIDRIVYLLKHATIASFAVPNLVNYKPKEVVVYKMATQAK